MGWEQARKDKVETQEYGFKDSLTWLIFSCQNSDTKVYFLKTCRFSVRSLQLYDEMSIFHWCCDSGCTHKWLCFSEISLFASVTPRRQLASFIICILWSKTEFQPGFWKKISPLPTAQQNEESLSICWRPDLNSRGFRSCRHISESRSNEGGDRRTS